MHLKRLVAIAMQLWGLNSHPKITPWTLTLNGPAPTEHRLNGFTGRPGLARVSKATGPGFGSETVYSWPGFQSLIVFSVPPRIIMMPMTSPALGGLSLLSLVKLSGSRAFASSSPCDLSLFLSSLKDWRPDILDRRINFTTLGLYLGPLPCLAGCGSVCRVVFRRDKRRPTDPHPGTWFVGIHFKRMKVKNYVHRL